MSMLTIRMGSSIQSPPLSKFISFRHWTKAFRTNALAVLLCRGKEGPWQPYTRLHCFTFALRRVWRYPLFKYRGFSSSQQTKVLVLSSCIWQSRTRRPTLHPMRKGNNMHGRKGKRRCFQCRMWKQKVRIHSFDRHLKGLVMTCSVSTRISDSLAKYAFKKAFIAVLNRKC